MAEDKNESVRSDSYMITHPGVFIEETPERVCIKLLQEKPLAARLTVRVFPENSGVSEESWVFRDSNKPLLQLGSRLEEDEREKCLQLALPKSKKTANDGGLLEIEIKSEDGSMDVMVFKEISIYQQETYMMIQTDKGHYKAKDKVKFRILVLDQNLKPPGELRTIDEIWVEDPMNRRIAQWKEVVRDNQWRLCLLSLNIFLVARPWVASERFLPEL